MFLKNVTIYFNNPDSQITKSLDNKLKITRKVINQYSFYLTNSYYKELELQLIEVRTNKFNNLWRKDQDFHKLTTDNHIEKKEPLTQNYTVYNLNMTNDLERVSGSSEFKGVLLANYMYKDKIAEMFEVQIMPLLDAFAKIGGLMKSFTICVICVSFINSKLLDSELI